MEDIPIERRVDIVDGLDKALQGHTSFDEVLRVTQEEALELD